MGSESEGCVGDVRLVLSRHGARAVAEPIRRLLGECDWDFAPPLSDRPGGIEKNLSDLSGDCFVLAVTEDGRSVGMLSYAPSSLPDGDGDGGDALLVTTLCVPPSFRGQGVARAMYGMAERQARRLGIARVMLCTWSTNKVHLRLLRSMGYSERWCARGGRGDRVDSVVFGKDVLAEG